MSLVFYKLVAALLTFVASLLIVIYPLKNKKKLTFSESAELGEALASGIFLGAAFFHLLPDALRIFSQIYGNMAFPTPEAICVAGFLILLFLERFSLNQNFLSGKRVIPYILILMLTIHALTEGAALGIGTTFSETMMLLIAILAHKGTETFALCVAMLRHQLSLRTIVTVIVLFSFMTPIGIVLGTTIDIFAFAKNGELIAASFDAFAAGTFLYISTLHHVHFHKHEKDTQGMLEFTCLLAGVLAMATIAMWV